MAFNFGATPATQSQTLQTGFSFGSTAKTTAAPTGFSFGSSGSLGSTTSTTTLPKPTLGFQNPTANAAGLGVKPLTLGLGTVPASTAAPAAAPAAGGLKLGTSTSGLTGFQSLGAATSSGATTTSAGGLTLNLGAPAAGGLAPVKLPATTTAATSSTGLTLKLGAPTTGGLTLGGGLGGGAPATTSSTGLTLKLGAPSTTTSVASTSGGLTLGGLGGTVTQPAVSTASAVKGLGGVDPATSTQNASKAAGAAGDGKRVKEGDMPNELVQTVTNFKKYVKDQKEIGAKISAVSSLQMNKVQEQTQSLKHLLSTVAVGLHRNVVALDKLKKQTSQELHNAEMAHRTKETPAGLQYENTAPNQYFHDLMESFDSRMALYRKLIEDTEGYLVGAQQGAAISPKDLFTCLKRLHETFIALAAQLQGIHEQVKEQKEHYLTFRKVFHNDETDVFEKRKKQSSDRSKLSRTSQPVGPTPFTGLSNFAAMMMNSAMNRQAPQQQPGAAPFTGFGVAAQPPTTGLFGGTGSTTSAFGGFGSTATQPTGGLFGSTTAATAKPAFGFGSGASSQPSAFTFPSAATSTATSKPFGFGFGSTATTSAGPSAFGFGSTNQANPKGFGFGSTQAGTSLFGSQPTAAVKPLGGATPSLVSSAPGFTLQPPNKRPNT